MQYINKFINYKEYFYLFLVHISKKFFIFVKNIHNMSIGKEIKQERKRQLLTQKQLSEMCNFSQMELSEYENEKRNPSLERLNTLSRVLNKEWKLQ